ncbi:MAG: GGDEF domain-containing protein [Wenzhouxiangellaceae bacterium]|nr:GGDEF domain-containing protein [Wenzhouxiangellaceae bacterium]
MVRFSIVSLVVLVGITGYRLAAGYLREGLIDGLMALGVALVLVHTLRTGETRRSGRLFACVAGTAAFASSAMFGVTGLFWGYVVLWINFMLATPRFALTLNLLLVAALGLQTELFAGPVYQVTYFITTGMIIAFAWMFTHQMAKYQAELEHLALNDPLTRSGNRRALRQAMNETAARNRPVSLLLLDIDHFKQLNDRHGHDLGDRLLLRFADLLRRHVRAVDDVFRFGGEEFIVLLHDLPPDAAEHAAERLHVATSGALEVDGAPVHYSAGLAHRGRSEHWNHWLRRADDAMYRAKQAGRNRLVIDRDETSARDAEDRDLQSSAEIVELQPLPEST